jgi:hypothetical protein
MHDPVSPRRERQLRQLLERQGICIASQKNASPWTRAAKNRYETGGPATATYFERKT